MVYLLVIVCCVLLLWILYRKFANKPDATKLSDGLPPGPSPSNKTSGNLEDIRNCGGFHQYVTKLHEQYGPITSFWMGEQRVVSLASAELFKQHQTAFDRPVDLFKGLMDLAGKNSIQFANGDHGRDLHKKLSKPFSFSNCINYYEDLHQVSRELLDKLSATPIESHIPIFHTMNVTALKGLVLSAFGCFISDEAANTALTDYDKTWEKNVDALKHLDKSHNEDEVKTGIVAFRKFASGLLEQRGNANDSSGNYDRFVDNLIAYDFPEGDHKVDNATTFLIGGFHTTGTLMTWLLYYLATHKEIQEKLYSHIVDVLGDRAVDQNDMDKLGYLHQVIDETLRLSQLAPYAARSSPKNIVLGGCQVPANTPVLLALGCSFTDSTNWPSPQSFDPDRFSEENSKSRHPFAFKPFGFAGKRICPGYRFAYVEVAVFISALLRRFVFRMVDGQDIKPEHGLVSKPNSEIWMLLDRR